MSVYQHSFDFILGGFSCQPQLLRLKAFSVKLQSVSGAAIASGHSLRKPFFKVTVQLCHNGCKCAPRNSRQILLTRTALEDFFSWFVTFCVPPGDPCLIF